VEPGTHVGRPSAPATLTIPAANPAPTNRRPATRGDTRASVLPSLRTATPEDQQSATKINSSHYSRIRVRDEGMILPPQDQTATTRSARVFSQQSSHRRTDGRTVCQ